MRKREHFGLPQKLPKSNKKCKVISPHKSSHSPIHNNSSRLCNTTRTQLSDDKSIHRIQSKGKPCKKYQQHKSIISIKSKRVLETSQQNKISDFDTFISNEGNLFLKKRKKNRKYSKRSID